MAENCIIIGLGQIGMGYDLLLSSEKVIYTHARAFSNHLKFKLVGAVDPVKSKRDLFKKHYSKPTYSTIKSAFQEQKASVVVIASPTVQHILAIKEVLAYSTPKLILCEKPLAYELSEAREIVKLCDNASVTLLVNYIRRADPGAIEIKRRIDSREITMPIKGVAWYSKGFLNNGSHFFNLLEFWLGSFKNAKILNKGRLWDKKDPEPDVQVKFEQGEVIFISAWEEAFSHYTIELLSPSGRLRYEQEGKTILWQSPDNDPHFSGYQSLKIIPEILKTGMNYYQSNVVGEIANALDEKPHTLSTGRQSLATLEAMHQIINQEYL